MSVTLRRVLGGILLLLAVLPVYRLLAADGTGPAGSITLATAAQAAADVRSGAAVLALAAFAVVVLLRERTATALGARVAGALCRPSLPLFALLAAAVGGALTLYVNARILYGEPDLIDAMTQLVHARYFAAGQLAGPPASELTAFWHTQNMLATENGWVSQYPPGHVALLALFVRLGRPELAGAVVVGLTVFVTALLAHHLWRTDPLTARIGTLLLAGSPFVAAHAAGYMNHSTAALLAVCAAYAAVRIVQGGGVLAGVALGLAASALFGTRPLTGVVVALVCAVWVVRARVAALPAVGAAAVLAALPVLLALAWYNDHFFGSPFTFGYTVALGPDGALGFGTDPWGNVYDVGAAIGYTSAELTALNIYLLESPIPVVALAAVFLIGAHRLRPGEGFLAAWAAAPVAAHFFYWHHGFRMGPRMLNEYSPAWALLAAAAALWAVRASPAALRSAPRWSPRVFVSAALVLGWVYGVSAGTPRRLATYRTAVLPLPYATQQLKEPALVFVHGSWTWRLSMELAARGLRLDSLETLMRANSTCAVQQWLDAGQPRGGVEFERGSRTVLRTRELSPGSRIRVAAGEPWPASCARQADADRRGAVEITAFLWRSGLPGIDDGRALVVRDLGPARNAELIRAVGRKPYLFDLLRDRQQLRLLPYEQVIQRLWRDSVPAATLALRSSP